MIIRLYLTILFGILFISLGAKELPKGYDAPVNLSKIDQMKLKKANDYIAQGRKIWDLLNEKYNPEEISSYRQDSICNKDAFPILLKAAKLFNDGNKMKYEIYNSNCADFWKRHRYSSPSGLDGAKKFQKEARSYIDSAMLNRRVANSYTNQYVQAYNRYYEAISLEIIATKKEARALQIYLDWPAHYSYEWDEDVEVNLFAKKPKINQEVTLDAKPDSIKTAPPLVMQEAINPNKIFYSVQIAAHTYQMTDAQLRLKIYKGPMLIREVWEDGWYKYLIGYFKTPDGALELLRKIDVEKAFVVAYKNGKRVPLKELQKEQADGQE